MALVQEGHSLDGSSRRVAQLFCFGAIFLGKAFWSTFLQGQGSDCVRNILDTYTCVINAQTPTVTKQTSTTKKTSTVITQKLATTTTQKPTTTKLLPAAIEQMYTATVQASTTLVSPACKPSANQAPMSQPVTCQPLPSYASRPVPIHSFGK
ncbi:hypothetical protein DSO57_1012096 [Entomophthora muscae]|uniref:Uncharacterized protein n=1 Tax=Entomophthora muscae TaxID=34485 RepID=A0ACC2SIV2_9FUNG|nr:hypothetical protein DSO57_1012096 [Entomophthora muscae]